MTHAASSALRILVADDKRDTVDTLRLVLQERAKFASAAATRGRC